MNTIKFVKATSIDLLSLNPLPGEIVYAMDSEQLYVGGSASGWMPLCNTHQNNFKKSRPRTCEGCGAVLTSNKCEYCGSEY